MRATWQGKKLAESDRCEIVEGNVYFPPDAVDRRWLRESSTTTTCSWKGKASYYDLVAGDEVNRDAAWYYPNPKPAAANIKGFIAFWRGVEVEGEPE